mmetsp:Transcript_113646/g.157232  ORF Transcript_113646/g.157232 Transcript_113646/m.157232 type:complete len:88 (-) Transcript_113646:551-814(-)
MPPASVAMPPYQELPMVGGSTAVTSMEATPTTSAPLVGGHFTQQSIMGALFGLKLFQEQPPEIVCRGKKELHIGCNVFALDLLLVVS